ncbi:hypothetical protein JCM19000A_38060 [Silvimonas sp. JCM 19000]
MAACGGGGSGGDNAAQINPTPTPTPSSTPTATPTPVPAPTASGDAYTPLSFDEQQPATQYTLADGTLVTQIGGRTRDRHAREQSDPPGSGDLYGLFAAHYFERRTHQLTIYENVSPTDPTARVLTIVMQPQWWLYGTNFREGYIGRRDGDDPGPTAVALYADNGGMKLLPGGVVSKTPIANYAALGQDPTSNNINQDLNVPPKPGEFVLVKQIDRNAVKGRALKPGDLVEFELGIFLSGDDQIMGRFNYYSDVLVYKVGTPGVQPWYRGPSTAAIPWDTQLLPATALSGGSMTLQEDTSGQPEMSLQQAGTNIAGINMQPWIEGRRLFHTSFLTGQHSETGNPDFTAQAGKAGPMFQQSSCIACHTANGKSSPSLNSALSNMVVMTGALDANGKNIVDSRFGPRMSMGLVTENGKTFDGRQAILKIDSYTQTSGSYPDGTAYTLQQPHYALTDTSGKALSLPTRFSVRAAPHLAGMGLLEAVPETELAALASASQSDADGAVGRLQIVADALNPATRRVGRFGWRGSSATVLQQTAAALNADMGVTTSVLPTRYCGLADNGTACRAADVSAPKLSDSDLDLLVRYTSLLAVPAQRHFAGEAPLGISATTLVAQAVANSPLTQQQIDAENATQTRIARGAGLFAAARCTACHVATLTTGANHRFAELRNQTIRPYSDLLLHDMGAALADSYAEGVASNQEWRTAPLWGLGLQVSINPNVRYLHDGRARTVEEAILWHGGQGTAARDRFKKLPAADRAQLIEFVNSL